MSVVVRFVRRGLSAAALAIASTVGCTDAGDAGDAVPEAVRTAIAARTIYPAKREEWRTDITKHTDSTMVPLVFRASRGTVALLQDQPKRLSQFELHGKGLLLSTRPARIDPTLNAEVPRDLIAPTELSRVTSSGEVDVIDSATSTLVRETIGGYLFRRNLPLLRGGSGRLCTVSPGALLHVRYLGARRVLEAFTLTAIAAEDSLIGRHWLAGDSTSRLRFGNGDVRRCLLLTARDVLIVSVPDSTAPMPRLDRLYPPGAPDRDVVSDGNASRASAGSILQPYIVDAAIVDGGFVVLVGLTSDRQGRIIDYYDARGRYLQSAMLPFTASAMAGSGPRFLVLHQDERARWWLSSWLTPMAARGATAPADPPRVDRAPERQLFALPGNR